MQVSRAMLGNKWPDYRHIPISNKIANILIYKFIEERKNTENMIREPLSWIRYDSGLEGICLISTIKTLEKVMPEIEGDDV